MSEKIRKQIVEVSHLLYSRGMVNPYEGNISFLDDDKVYITPSGICKGFLTEEMIVVTDRQGVVLEGTYKPTSEIRLHLAAYNDRPDIRSVGHTHSPYATSYAIANKPIITKAYPEMIEFFDYIPLAAYGTPSTDEIYTGAKEYIQDFDIILLANHGVMAVGKDVYDTYFKLDAVESIAKTLTLARQLGGERDLPQHKLEEIYELRRKIKQRGR